MSFLKKIRKALEPAPRSRRYGASISALGHVLPVEVVVEPRREFRYSITGKKIILRAPVGCTTDDIRDQLIQLQAWAEPVLRERPELFRRYVAPTYQSGSTLTVGRYEYTLDVRTETRDDSSIRQQGRHLTLLLSDQLTAAQRTRTTRKLLAKAVAAHQKNDITRRVLELNRATVNRPIRGVTLKYNHSNWGSCSSRSNINLSTRLLFAPLEVQDYVIIHELAHLVEHNHSDRFWAVVAQYLPDYERHERWLKEHGATCDF
jgi:predicted metal-dependent hydrolase